MKKDSLISVIIPVYNVRDFLCEAVESVLCQTYKNLEIIIVDDGSTDGGDGICDEFAKKDTRVTVVHQANRGLSGARNTGLNMMSGEAVVFLDSDDAYHPDFIKDMVSAMIRENADIVVCKYTCYCTMNHLEQDVTRKSFPAVKGGCLEREDALRALAEGSVNVQVWNKLYVRKLWDDIRFPDGLVYEDMIPSCKVFNLTKSIYVVDRVLYYQRRREGSITDVFSWKNINDRLAASSEFDDFFAQHCPQVFENSYSRRRTEACLEWMIRGFVYNSKDKRNELTDKVRDLIIETGEKININTCGFRIRMAYKMVKRCPRFLIGICRIYRPAHALFNWN